MKISLKEYQRIRHHHLLLQMEGKDWREGIWWTRSPTSLIGFYGMGENSAKQQLNWETFEVHTPLGSRLIGKQRLLRLYPLFLKTGAESFYRGDPIYETIKEKKSILHSELANLGFQEKRINKTSAELKRDWLVVTERQGKEKTYHHWTNFTENNENQNNLEIILRDIFNVFGYMTLDGISLLLGIRPYYFVNILTAMERDNILHRPFRLIEGKKDIFALKEIVTPENLELEVNEIVLEESDALASLLFFEEGRPFGNQSVFVKKGQPLAFFKLKIKKKNISVSDFYWTSGSIEKVQQGIKTWGERNGFHAQIDYRSSQMGKHTIFAIESLLKRGYVLKGEGLEIKKGTEKSTLSSRGIMREIAFSWLIANQVEHFRSEQEIIDNIIQANSLDCLAIRLERVPNLEGINAILGRGGNGRLGIMRQDVFRAFSSLETKDLELTLTDQKILKILDSFPGMTVSELSTQMNISYSKILQRIRFLEKKYRIIRLGLSGFDENSANWAINHHFDVMEQEEAEDFLVSTLLKKHLPLTSTMISRFFGWHFSTIEKILERLKDEGSVVKGHFIQYPDKEIQYSWKGRADEINKKLLFEKDTFFVPFEDPLSIIYFPMFIQLHPSLQPRSLQEFENGSIVFKGTSLVGYISKSNVSYLGSSGRRVNYVVNLRVLKEWMTRGHVVDIFDHFIKKYNAIWGLLGSVGKVNGKSIKTLFGEEIHIELENRELDHDFI